MIAHRITLDAAARRKSSAGATRPAVTVRITLGPRSHSVPIAKRHGEPIVGNDGVTIARETELEGPGADLGADLEADLGARTLRQAAEHTGEGVLLPSEAMSTELPAPEGRSDAPLADASVGL